MVIQMNILKKVLVLVLGAGLATFLALGIFSYFGKKVVQRDMADMSSELGVKSASYIDDLVTAQLKKTFGESAKAKAQIINHEMSVMKEDAETLSDVMTNIISHPENFMPRTPPDPRVSPIKNGQTYLTFAPDIRDNVTPEMLQKISIAANIAVVLEEMTKSYSVYNCTAFAGSVEGWYFCNRILLDDDGKADFNRIIPFSRERIYEFDARKRPWYVKAEKFQQPVISDLYATFGGEGETNYQQIGASAPFYDAQGNFAGVVGLDASNADIYNDINDTHFTDSGANFVVNENYELIFCSEKNKSLIENNLVEIIENATEGVSAITLDGKDYYLAYLPLSDVDWNFGMLVSEEEILKSTQNNLEHFTRQVEKLQSQMQHEYSYLNNLTVIIPISLLVVLFLMSVNLSRRFVKPIHELSNGVREISGGNLDKKLDIHTGDEIEHLATCFNAMTDELRTYIKNLAQETADKERIATELDVARDIQFGMLPKDFPARSDFELLATMTPAKEVGGDFYDFYFLDDKHLAITVADVSGKGISAALFMVISKTILNNFMETFYKQNGLAQVVEAANEQLCANNDAMMFVTAFVGVLDLETGEFIYVNGGHNPPVVYHAEKNSCDFLDVKKNFVLGPMDGIPFTEQKITLSKGDLIFIYTDGVTEALNVHDEEYLPDRLIDFMNKTDCRADLQTLLKNIRADVSTHVGEAEQSDDITMFALRFNGD